MFCFSLLWNDEILKTRHSEQQPVRLESAGRESPNRTIDLTRSSE